MKAPILFKAALLLILGIINNNCLLAQSNQTQTFLSEIKWSSLSICDSNLTDQYYSKAWHLNSEVIYSPNSNGYLGSYSMRDSNSKLIAKYIFYHNSSNLCDSGYGYYNYGGSMMLFSSVTVTRNNADEVITELVKSFNGSGLGNSEKYQYSYSSGGEMIRLYKQKWNGHSWIDANLDSFTYNGSNQVSQQVIYEYNSSTSKLELNQRTTYSYNAKGKKTNEATDNYVSGTWQKTSRQSFTYDASDSRIASYNESYNSGAWNPSGADSSKTIGGVSYEMHYNYNSGSKTWGYAKRDYCGNTSSSLAPAAPSNLTASAHKKVNDGKILLTWTDNSNNEKGFIVFRSTDGTNFTAIDSLPANITSFDDTGLVNSTKYYYKIAAWNSSGQSSFSNQINTSTLTTGIFEVTANKITGLFPNPASTGVTMLFTSATGKKIIRIIDMSGRVILSKESENMAQEDIKLTGLTPGIFTVEIQDGAGIEYRKLVLCK